MRALGSIISLLLQTLAVHPKCLLLDEPFSALDVGTQVQVRQELKEILVAAKVPAILVTHDLRDAVAFGDRICLMERGEIVLCGDGGINIIYLSVADTWIEGVCDVRGNKPNTGSVSDFGILANTRKPRKTVRFGTYEKYAQL